MNDDVENQPIDTTPDEPKGPQGGERLADARRELQISVLEIAKELHLDEPKVRALERNEFDVLGAPVFAKGHLKTYAQLVNVDPADVLSDYYHLTRSVGIEPLISARPKPRRELTPGPWIAVIVAIVVIVSVFLWFSRADEPGPAATVLPAAEEETVVLPPSTVEDEPVAVPEQDDRMAVETPAIEPVIDDEPELQPAVADGTLHLLVTYSGDCWTEITDASGRRLLFDLGKDGRTVELRGAEPFNVLFGNPGNVSLRVDGQDYALPATTRPDRPMRLTISGS